MYGLHAVEEFMAPAFSALKDGFGAGLATVETGLRLRYEFRRELAPYIGITWDRKFFGTADLARAAGERASGTAVAIGLRTWF